MFIISSCSLPVYYSSCYILLFSNHSICVLRLRGMKMFYLSMFAERFCFFFFFQAEDGIRDLIVTGVQTCALPISDRPGLEAPQPHPDPRLHRPGLRPVR